MATAAAAGGAPEAAGGAKQEAAAKVTVPKPGADSGALAEAPKLVSMPEVINGLLESAADAGSVKPEEGVVDGPVNFAPSVAAGAPARMHKTL